MASTESEVTIVIKSSSQSAVDDYTVVCKLGWTIQQIKEHIAQNHPSKPPLEEQRLIYSGQLLYNHLCLRDILRVYSDQASYTIHLVFSNHNQVDAAPSPSKQTVPDTRVPTEGTQTLPTSSFAPSLPSTNNVRYRHPATVQHPHQFISGRNTASLPINAGAVPLSPEMQYQMLYQQALNWSTMNPEQMAWMQQAYSNFMASYLQYYQSGSPLLAPMMTQSYVQQQPQQQAQVPAQNPPQQQQDQAGGGNNENIQMNAQGGPVDEDEEEFGNRDWLDWFYVLTRAAVLFSIVYFYSTLGRFLMVTILTALFYVYQVGWFRQQRVQQPQNQQQRPNNVVEEVQGDVQAEDGGEEDLIYMMDAEDGEGDGPEQAAESPGVLVIIQTFLITFFSSLIPEQPPPVNAN